MKKRKQKTNNAFRFIYISFKKRRTKEIFFVYIKLNEKKCLIFILLDRKYEKLLSFLYSFFFFSRP